MGNREKDSLPWEPYDGRFCSDTLPVHLDSPLSYLEYLAGKRTQKNERRRGNATGIMPIRDINLTVYSSNNRYE